MDETLDRDEWLHYVHTWDESDEEEQEMVVSVNEMEEILAQQLVAAAKSSQQTSVVASREEAPIFYHDHDNGGKLVFVGSDFYIGPSRAGLLRVIGCGHFLLSLYRQFIDNTVRAYAHRKDLAWVMDFLRSVTYEWQQGPLNIDVPCSAALGIGQHFNEFATTWLTMNTSSRFSPKQAEYYLKVRGVHYQCRTLCFSDHSQDLPEKCPDAFREFLFLHMCCIAESLGPQVTNPYLISQYALMNRKYEAPSLPALPTTQPMLLLASEVEDAVLKWAQKGQGGEVKFSDSKQVGTSIEYMNTYSEVVEYESDSDVEDNAFSVARGAGGTTQSQSFSSEVSASSTWEAGQSKSTKKFATVAKDANTPTTTQMPTRSLDFAAIGVTDLATLTSQWTRYENFNASDWEQMEDGKHVKVVDSHWKLGCKGCPDSTPPPAMKNDKGKHCSKWVTVKKTVLVKRPPDIKEPEN